MSNHEYPRYDQRFIYRRGGCDVSNPYPDILNFYRNNRKQHATNFNFKLATMENVERTIYSIRAEAVGNRSRHCPHILPD